MRCRPSCGVLYGQGRRIRAERRLGEMQDFSAILTLEKPQAQERKQEGRKKGGGDRKSEKRSVGTSHNAIPADKSRDKAAKAAGTSAKTMARGGFGPQKV